MNVATPHHATEAASGTASDHASPPIHHVAVLHFKPDVTTDHVDGLRTDLLALAGELDGLLAYSCGTDLGLRDGTADFGISAVFATSAALATYLAHPSHLEIIARHVKSLVASKASAQFADLRPASGRTTQWNAR